MLTTPESDEPAPAVRGVPSEHYEGESPTLGNLVVQLSDVSRMLQSKRNIEETFDTIAAAAVSVVPGAQHAGISVTENRRNVHTAAATSELAFRVDDAQFEVKQGPALEVLYAQRTIRVANILDEDRWPEFIGRAAMLGIGSMLSVQLFVIDNNLGALNLYAGQPGAFSDESEDVGLLFATHAAVAMADAQEVRQLSDALDVRDIIGQAKGILIERHRVTGDKAFTMLVQASQRTNTRLVAIARHLVESGELLGAS